MNICTTETAAASQDTVNGKNPHSLIDWIVSAIASRIGRAAALSDSGAVPTYAATVHAPPSVAVFVEGKLEGNNQASDRVD